MWSHFLLLYVMIHFVVVVVILRPLLVKGLNIINSAYHVKKGIK